MTDNLLQSMQDAARQAGAEGGRAAVGEVIRTVKNMKRLDVELLRTPRQCSQDCPAFTIHRIRKLLALAEINGLESSGAAFKVEGRWLIHMAKFDRWFTESLR